MLQALAQAYPRHPAKKHMREAVEMALKCRDAGDWLGVGTANMEFHKGIVELADSERLNVLFAHILVELRLAFGLLKDPEFLHAPCVDMNTKLLELIEAGKFAEGSASLNDYLIHSERIVLAVYAAADAGALASTHQAAASSSLMPSCVASNPRRSRFFCAAPSTSSASMAVMAGRSTCTALRIFRGNSLSWHSPRLSRDELK